MPRTLLKVLPTIQITMTSSEIEEIEVAFKNAFDNLLNIVEKNICIDEITFEFTRELLQSFVLTRQHSSAYAMIQFYRSIKPKRRNEDDNSSYMLGWCIEIILAAFVVDDLINVIEMKNSNPNSNERNLLENIAYRLLLNQFGHTNGFRRILNTILSINYKRLVILNLEDQKSDENQDMNNFCWEIYTLASAYKSTHFILYVPFAAAASLAGVTDPMIYTNLKEMALHIGILYQIQNDMIDYCKIQENSGNNDIVNGKCTWLIIQAIAAANKEQKQILLNTYGKTEGEAGVRRIYTELNIPSTFTKIVDEEFKIVLKSISSLPDEIPAMGLRMLATTIFKRIRNHDIHPELLKN